LRNSVSRVLIDVLSEIRGILQAFFPGLRIRRFHAYKAAALWRLHVLGVQLIEFS